MDAYSVNLLVLIENDKVPMFNQVTALRFSGVENNQITYQADSTDSYSAEDVYYTKQKGGILPLDSEKVERYLGALQNLSLTNYMSYKATDEELKKYGLDEPELTVTIDYTTEDVNGKEVPDSFTLHISRDSKENGSIDEEDVTAYARVGDSSILYKITSESYKKLMDASYDSLRHSELFWGDFADVQQIDVTLEGSSYTITSEKSRDSRQYSYAGAEVSLEDVQNKLEALHSESFTEETPTQKKEIGLTLHLDSQTHPTVQIDLYRYDGTHCLAAIDGTSVSLVSRSNVVALIEAIHTIVLN